MYKAIIIDDEPKLSKVLKRKLNENCPEVEVLDILESASDGYQSIINFKPDIVFLDIAMPRESGFDMLGRFDSINFEIIFVTGYNDFAIDALRVSAVDYILKPVSSTLLVNAVEKAIKRINTKSKIKKYDLLKHNVKSIGDQSSKIAIPGSHDYDFVLVSDIIRCEGWQKYTKIYLNNKKTMVSSYNLGVFREMLQSYHFYSIHRSHLINIKHITKYLREGTVIMSDGIELPVARRRREEFIDNVIKNSA